MTGKKVRILLLDLVGVLLAAVVFLVPFYFIIVNAMKGPTEASEMSIQLPRILILDNFSKVLNYQNGIVLKAFFNSISMTIFSIVCIVVFCSMASFVMQRNQSRMSPVINFFMLVGLMLPPAIVPTFWVLNTLHIFKTMASMVLIETAINMSFCVMLYRAFVGSIPREIDEAAIIDGCGSLRLFFSIIFPLLKPVTATAVVLNAVNIFNDFVNPLYFLPGKNNVTVQLTLYYFHSAYNSSWNLLFADVVLISIPPLILYIFFNKQIVSGMTAGAVKA
ncbi:MAG TPA: carbohydrate ABC transporter permease [Clostridiales bacterium]|nr:carbohydrate ABC transporter permease [Clostridiales bacterium]